MRESEDLTLPIPKDGVTVKRNADLIRRIALATEELKPMRTLDALDSVDQFEFSAHVEWMKDAGLVDATIAKNFGGVANHAIVNRLTWDGCDFLDAARSETLWAKAKESVIAPTASWTFDILKEWLKAEIKNGLPSIRGLTG